MFCRLRITDFCNRINNHINGFNLAVVNYSTPSISLGKSKKIKQATGPVLQKKALPVETDTSKLVKYVCGSNIFKEGEDVELKPDNEYPEWLWTLHTGKPLTLDEMDPNSLKYWKKVRVIGMRKKNKLISMRKL